jgi:hypothetical protein
MLVTRLRQYVTVRPVPTPPKLSTNALLGLGLGACALLIVLALVGTRILIKPPPPPPPPAPAPESSVTGLLRFTPGYYRAILDDDAKKYGLPKVDPEELAAPLDYADELGAPRRLKADRDGLETPHLKLGTRVIKEWATTGSGQRFRFEHQVLTLTNKSPRPLAYRVETSVDHPEKCSTKGAIAHNALALQPGETVERTECLWHPGAMLTVRRVEILELPPLGYQYVSRLVPSQVLFDERTSAGHDPGKVKPCQFVPWREIQNSVKDQGTGWADVIDFYARHNCDEYSFWPGYRRWLTRGSLPSRAPGAPVGAQGSSK